MTQATRRWEVRTGDRMVQIDAPNWFTAIGGAVPKLGLEPYLLLRMVCEMQADGAVTVRDRATKVELWARPIEEERAPTFAAPKRVQAPVLAMASDAAQPPEDAPSTDDDSEEVLPTATAPRLAMPTLPEAPPPSPDELAERLFDMSAELVGARHSAEAADLALQMLAREVPARSGSVLRRDPEGARFIAAFGPAATQVMGRVVPRGQGIANLCIATGHSFVVRDVHREARFDRSVDALTGLQTRALLAAAIRDAEGQVYGCIELLDPSQGFRDWHLDAACSVAAILAERIRDLG